MDVKEAVRTAAIYVAEMESLTSKENEESDPMLFLNKLRFAVEGTRFDENKENWHIEVGFTRPWDRATQNPLAGLSSVAGNDKRTLKTVTISDKSKEIIAYK